MLNRISKTILVLTICLGISIPTNAAVSVSDGSAFVTKAEFAADLNNLSNRMAQLENSLDAKIDSLVSSYLTRNGIWNGAKQDILTTEFVADSPKAEAIGYNPYTLNVSGEKKKLFLANKSGLCFIDYDWYSTYGASAQAFWGYNAVHKPSSKWKNFPDDSMIITLYFLNESSEVLTVQTLASAKSTFQGWDNNNNIQSTFYLAVPLPPSQVRIINSFFVTKGSNYYVQFRAFVNLGYSDGSTPSVNGGGLKFSISGANIY